MSAALHPLIEGVPPTWATCWGDSKYGPWAGFMENNIVYAMYWIPQGRFVMGSPPTEAGREDREAYKRFFETQHEVEITQGFWMAEWPCTQHLWTSVMGDDQNPSRFKDPWRPVENVSWRDVQSFVTKLNARHPGLDARLPTEAEWEYACRAGTSTATYAGNLQIRGERNAAELDEIAWYGGNSGVDYDLAEGRDSSEWEGKQYEHALAGTRRVGTRRPNPWGLCDTLGNVWEWCQDWHAPYSDEPVRDPRGPEVGTGRVVRGGAWNGLAQDVRAAARFARRPSDRDGRVGFRFLRGQAAPRGGPEGP